MDLSTTTRHPLTGERVPRWCQDDGTKRATWRIDVPGHVGHYPGKTVFVCDEHRDGWQRAFPNSSVNALV